MTYRSMLFVPGNRPSRMTQALGSGADAIVLDLEDSVADREREQARVAVAKSLSQVARGVDCWVRVVAADEPGFALDLDAAVRPGLTGIVLPGANRPEMVRSTDEVITGIERSRGIPAGSIELLPMAESALGVRNLFDSLTASARVTVATFPGAPGADLCTDLGVTPSTSGAELLYVRSKVLLDARAAGIGTILDGVWVDLDDLDGLHADAAFGRRLGYTGRLAVHPSQLPVLHGVFTPSSDELADARELLDAYTEARSRGDGAMRHRGRLVDRAMAGRAERLLTLAERPGAQP